MQGRLTAKLCVAGSDGRRGSKAGPELIDYGRQGRLFIPASTASGGPYPLLVMLHGATYDADSAMSHVRSRAADRGYMVFAPKSEGRTWDLIRTGFGPDFNAINEALEHISSGYPIDAGKVAIGGFSDGASYALTLGLLNGDLFKTTLAFSPGFTVAKQVVGRPRIYISHGVSDPVLPFERCGAALARVLADAGLDVKFDPFEGGHTVPDAQVESASDWWLRD